MDKGIVSLRRWLGSLAGPIPWPFEAAADVWVRDYTRPEILDRYNQHTKNCKHCSKVGALAGSITACRQWLPAAALVVLAHDSFVYLG